MMNDMDQLRACRARHVHGSEGLYAVRVPDRRGRVPLAQHRVQTLDYPGGRGISPKARTHDLVAHQRQRGRHCRRLGARHIAAQLPVRRNQIQHGPELERRESEKALTRHTGIARDPLWIVDRRFGAYRVDGHEWI